MGLTPELQWTIGTALVVVFGLATLYFTVWQPRRRKQRTPYEVIWKKSEDLPREKVLLERAREDHGYREYYFERDHDKVIAEKLKAGQSFIVVGRPLAGKSRAVFRALRRGEYHVTIPKVEDVDQSDFKIPGRFFEVRKQVLLLNDIDKFFAKRNFEQLFNQFLLKNAIIIATCRKSELPKVDKALDGRFTSIFKQSIEIPDLTDANAGEVAKGAERESGEPVKIPDAFDHTIGSLFVPLDTMRQRFGQLTGPPRCFLLAMRRLYAAGVYEGREEFSIQRIKRVCRVQHEIDLKKHEWNGVIGKLQEQAFIKKDGDTVTIEECYLQQVIADEFDILENLRDMLEIFKDDPQACFYVGIEAYHIGKDDLEIAKYMRLAIRAINCAFENWTLEENPEVWAVTQGNLGNALQILAGVEDTGGNCRKAITAFEEALKVYTPAKFPMHYASTQNNLGAAYQTLAQIENKADNCQKAIAAYEQALKVYTLDKFPMDYAMTQNNLEIAHQILAGVEDTGGNCRKAITAFEEALKVYTPAKFPMDYAMTQNNLGNAYQTLAEAEEKAGNCKKAIAAYEEALKVLTVENFPFQYAVTQNNLGIAHQTLAEVKDTADNCKKAIAAYEQALKVRTLEEFPMDYAMTQNNLGNAYGTLAEVENKEENTRKAIAAYEEALKVYTLNKFPVDYAMTQNNLGIAYRKLGDIEDKADNCNKAIAAYEQALEVRTLNKFPMDYALTLENVGIAFWALAETENKKENCRIARGKMEEALQIFIEQGLTLNVEKVKRGLARLETFCKIDEGGEGCTS